MSNVAPSCGAAPWDGADGFAAMADNLVGQSFDSGQGLNGDRKFSTPSHEQDERWRELFPLPTSEARATAPGASVSSRRRCAQVRKREKEVNSIVKCLNEMYCAAVPPGKTMQETSAQRSSHHEIFKQLGRLKQPKIRCSTREAIKELLHSPVSYNGDENMTTVRPYERSLVSLPNCGANPIPLHEVLDDEGREVLKGAAFSMLLSEDECGEIVEKGDFVRPYMDSRLQSDEPLYQQFAKDLWEKGMVDFTQQPGDLVTPFFVNKKDGRLRFILDCRGVNKRFKPPPPMALAAGSSWSQVNVPPGSTLYCAQSDIKDYFYSLALPSSLQSLFCLPPLPRSEVMAWGVSSPDLPEALSSGWLWPRLRVVPMGWSWAMYFAQRAHQHLCLQATGLGVDRVLVEGRPSPDLSDSEVALIPYADNLNVTGISAQRVQEVKDLIVKKLRDIGFRVHEETEAQSTVQSLGFLVDGVTGTIQPVPERLDRVVRCFAWLGKAPRISGRAVERLLGHAVHLCMLRRELLSIFRSLYDFIHSSYKVRTKLWPSAAKEARWASHLMKLCSSDLKRTWSTSITSSDASLSGIAVSRRDISTAEQALHGSYKETWRYKYKMQSKPRDHALSKLDPFEDISTVKPVKNEKQDPFALDDNFPEVDASILKPEDWHDVFAVRMSYPEPITVLEGRGVVAAFRHKLRSSEEFNRRHLHLNDNLSVVLLCSKGRSSSFAMLRTCRRLAALALATNCLFAVRWIPSELNVSDKASRQWESLRRQELLAGSIDVAGNDSNYIPWIKNEELKEEVDRLCYPNRFNWGSQRRTSINCAGVEQQKEINKSESAKYVEDPRREDCFSVGEVGGKKGAEEIQDPDTFGEASGVSPSGHGLSSPDAGTGDLCQKESPELKEHPEVRRGLLQVCQQFVRKRLRPSGWHKNTGGDHRQPPRLWPQAHASSNPSSFARVGKNRASADEASTAMCFGVSNGSQHDATSATHCSYGHLADVHGLSTSRRSYGPSSKRLDFAHARATNVFPPFTSSRKKRTVKGGAFRREPPLKLSADAMVRPCLAGIASEDQLPLGPDLRPAGGPMETGLDPAGAGCKSCSSIPAETLRAKSRQISSSTFSSGGQATRKMKKRPLSQEIRSSCQDQPRVSSPAQDHSDPLLEDGADSSSNGPRVYKPKAMSRKPFIVVEFFSGCARLSKACAEQGFLSFAFDIEYNPGCDLLQERVWKSVVRFIKKHHHRIILIWMGTPCTSWSRARRCDGGPPPLRDDDQFLMSGMPGLSMRDQHKVAEGNQLLSRTLDIISLADDLQLRWVLENPFSSRIWLTSRLAELQRKHADLYRIDFCAYGMPWRKSTGLMCSRFPSIAHIAKICSSPHSRCQYSGHRHIALSGKDNAGVWYTRRAQPYPLLLCRAIAGQLSLENTRDSG